MNKNEEMLNAVRRLRDTWRHPESTTGDVDHAAASLFALIEVEDVPEDNFKDEVALALEKIDVRLTNLAVISGEIPGEKQTIRDLTRRLVQLAEDVEHQANEAKRWAEMKP